jgi:ATP-dependent DNA helicase 2 subunit 2
VRDLGLNDFSHLLHSVVDTMRKELVDYEEPVVYNDFVRQLKAKMLREELGGDRRELWWFVRKGKLGLIAKSEVDSSAVEEEEANWRTKSLYTTGSS